MATADRFEHIHRQIWQQLQQATGDSGDLWRTPVLSTLDAEGLPDSRTLVLRSADMATQTLTFFSDRRSPKIGQLRQHAHCSLLFWCPKRQWQLRIRAVASVETDTEQTAEIWQRIAQSAAAGDYLTPQAPGTPLPEPSSDTAEPAPADKVLRTNLCLLHLKVQKIDWLALSPNGHRRALLADQHLTWLTP